MRNFSIGIYLFFACITLLGGCSRRPSDVLPKDKMIAVLTDIQLAQVIYNSNSEGKFNSNEQKDAIVNGVFAKHHTTQEKLNTSLQWYADNMEIYAEIKDSVTVRLRTRSTILNDRINQLSLAKEKQKEALSPAFLYLNNSCPTLSFSIDSVKIANLDIAHFRWSFDVQGLNKYQHLRARIFFIYKDTTVQQLVTIDKNRHYVFTKPALPDSLLQKITGYVHLQQNNSPATVLLYNILYKDTTSTAITANVPSHTEPIPTPEVIQSADDKIKESNAIRQEMIDQDKQLKTAPSPRRENSYRSPRNRPEIIR